MRTSLFVALMGASLVFATVTSVQAQGPAVSSSEYVDIGFGSLDAPDGSRYRIQTTARQARGPGGDITQLWVWVYQLVPNDWGYDDGVTVASFSGHSATEPVNATVNVIADKSASIRSSFVPQYGTVGGALSIEADCLPTYTSSFVSNTRYRDAAWVGDGGQHLRGNSFGGECTVTLRGAGVDWTFHSAGAIVQAISGIGH